MLRRHTEILRWLLDHEPSTLPRHLRDTLEPGWLQGVIEGLAWVRGAWGFLLLLLFVCACVRARMCWRDGGNANNNPLKSPIAPAKA